MIRADKKSQVRQYLGFGTADFWSSLAYESAEQKPKHCLTWDFLSALLMMLHFALPDWLTLASSLPSSPLQQWFFSDSFEPAEKSTAEGGGTDRHPDRQSSSHWFQYPIVYEQIRSVEFVRACTRASVLYPITACLSHFEHGKKWSHSNSHQSSQNHLRKCITAFTECD